jgi:hypothetical protein
MSRTATLSTVLAIAVAPAAIARPADYRSADPHTADRIAMAEYYGHQEARRLPACCPNPTLADAPVSTAKASQSDGGSNVNWAILAVAVAAVTAAAVLAVKASRQARPGAAR